MKNYGFIQPEIKPEDYVFGAFGITDAPILCPDRNWMKYRPAKEIQRNADYDTYNCTGFATNNQVETLLKRLFGGDWDYSDRATGVVAGTYPPGNSPHKVLEAVRKYGFMDEIDLPFKDVKTVDEYYSCKPIGRERMEKYMSEWKNKYVLKHDWVFTGGSIDFKCKAIWDALQYSPVAVSVKAWKLRGDKYYKNEGEQDNHWTLVLGGKEGEYWEVFDSYDQTIKALEWKYDFGFAKRIRITTVAQEQTFMKSLQDQLNKIKEALQVIAQRLQELLNPPAIQPHESLLKKWALAIERMEDDESNPNDVVSRLNNPGAIKKSDGSFLEFDSYEEGFAYLCEYLVRCATGKHKAYPNGGDTTLLEFFKIYAPTHDNNNPEHYANFVAQRINVDVNTQIKHLL